MNRLLKFLFTILIFAGADVYAQCPENIGFEDGTFKGWQTYTGEVAKNGEVTVNETSQPEIGRHHIMSASSEDVDPYGKFPVHLSSPCTGPLHRTVTGCSAVLMPCQRR